MSQDCTRPLISVIIPLYNVAPWLEACLCSAQSQTCRQIELLCIDDASVDASADIVRGAASADGRIRSLTHEVNRGQAASRNDGLAMARGRYVFFLDAHDLLACDDALEELLRTAEEDDADETLGRMMLWYPESETYNDGYMGVYQRADLHAVSLRDRLELAGNCVPCNKLLRRDFLEYHQIRFDEQLRKYEDNPFTCKIHCLARRISYRHKHTYSYRQRKDGSVMHSVDSRDSFRLCQAMLEELSVLNAFPDEAVRVSFLRYLPGRIKHSFCMLDDAGAWDRRQELKRAWRDCLASADAIPPKFMAPSNKTLDSCLWKTVRRRWRHKVRDIFLGRWLS